MFPGKDWLAASENIKGIDLSMLSVLVEGWSNINHSYALVNQFQLLELLKLNINLYFNEIPVNRSDWNSVKNASGLSFENQQKLKSIPIFSDAANKLDLIYRITYPLNFQEGKADRVFVFGTSEFQHLKSMIVNDDFGNAINNPGFNIVTPSAWSRAGFLKAGFSESQINVVPHGVDTAIYRKPDADTENRFKMEFNPVGDSYVFLSVGAMTWNKGIDVLLIAFAILRKKYPHIKLVLKDQSNLYGVTGRDVLNDIAKKNPAHFGLDIISSIFFVGSNLSLTELNLLYASASCYVSPYRAEGFNLTPLEAAATGVPVIMTGGGATDDYFDSSFASKISGKLMNVNGMTYIEPDYRSLVEHMTVAIEDRNRMLNPEIANAYIRNNFSWASCTSKLLDCLSRA